MLFSEVARLAGRLGTGLPPAAHLWTGDRPCTWLAVRARSSHRHTRAICFNNRQHQDWSADYKLFSRSPWDARALFAPVVHNTIAQYCPNHIHVGLDSTTPGSNARAKGQDRLLA